MKGHIGSFLLGVGAAVAGAFAFDEYRRRGTIAGQDVRETVDRVRDAASDLVDRASNTEIGKQAREVIGQASDNAQQAMDSARQAAAKVVEMANLPVDINEASREDLRAMGIEDEAAERLIEGRPYRNKMDLITRMIVPQDVYDAIKERIEIHNPNEGVKVA